MEHENALQDKLLLQMLELIETSVLCKMSIETTTNAGQLLLAKSRYIQGTQSASASRLPTENSNEFNALKKVETNSEQSELQLASHEIDKTSGFIDPLRWFGVLVPRSLQLAQDHFTKAIDLIIECANIQLKLNYTISSILLLRNKN